VLISVVIPTRNRPDLLLRAVKSALAQTHRELEVLVVIDGPCAKSSAALAGIADARLRPIVLPASVGGSDARNAGVRHATGEWIAFLDDDDEWLPTKLEKQAAMAMEATEPYPIISTGMVGISPTGRFPWPRRYPGKDEPICEYLFNRRSLFRGEGQVQTSVLMTRKTLLELAPFTSGLRRHQDTEWYLRVDRIPGVAFHFVREPLVLWYMNYCCRDDYGALAADTHIHASFVGVYVTRAPKTSPTMSVSLGADGSATVTQDPGQGSSTYFGHWQDDGKQIKVTFNALEGEQPVPPMVFESAHNKLQAVSWNHEVSLAD